MIFPEQNSTNFPISVKNNMLSLVKQEYNKKDFLRYHQFIVYNYLIKNEQSRGILLFHAMGMGKSITAVAIAEYYRLHDNNRNIVILLSKSLQQNFKKNISKYIKENVKDGVKDVVKNNDINKLSDTQIDDMIDKKYKFVSLNASNMFTQMTRISKTKEELYIEKQLKEFTDIVEKDDFLENSVLIIDEFHNLANSITNGSYNAIRLYDTIMKTKNIKLIFLTGTPIVNNPFELVPTFNMLKGYIGVNNKKLAFPLFPELQKDFYNYFVDIKKNKIKNQDRFENRVFGMVSYYGNMYFGNKKQEGFPEELPLKIEKVHMSADQFSKYDAARDLEKEEASIKRLPSRSERFSSKGSVSSSYRVKSRQISNFIIPDYALTLHGKKVIKHIDKLTKSDLQNLNVFSPKFKKILENIQKFKNQLGLFYSEFVSGEGIAIFAKILNLNGFECWQKNIKLHEDADAFDLNSKTNSNKKKCVGDIVVDGGGLKTYAIISGDIDIETRSKIVKIFNSVDNMKGEKIALLLVSKTGAEGLDLKNVRHIHICEPYWNMARIDQIIARGVRYLSHDAMPVNDRTVQPFIYLSDYPKDYKLKKKTDDTTDIDLFTHSAKNKNLINQFLVAIANASIDCSLHEPNFPKSVHDKIKCMLCAPTGKPLYNAILSRDFALKNPCEELKSSSIQASEIMVDDVKYYYTKPDKKSKESSEKNKYSIFKYDTSVNGYVPLQSHEHPYSEIMRKLLKI